MATEQHASIMKVFDNTGSMRRDVYEVSSGTDGGGMAMERWEAMRQADVACQRPGEERNFASYSARVIWSVI